MTEISAVLDQWRGAVDDPIEFSNVVIDTVVDLIGKLNAETHTLLSLAAPDGRILMIGGGKGQYIVCRINSDGLSATLTGTPAFEGRRVGLLVGGQLGDYPACQVCGIGDALRAVEAFYANCTDDAQVWIDD